MANPKSDMRVTRALLTEYAEKYKNWGRWGPDDEIGTLNFTTPDDIVGAAQLVKKGKTMSLGLNYDQFGPQGAKTPYPAMGRFNPIHMMTRTGTDAYSGVLDHRGIRGADDLVMMPLQCGTQWDGLGHVFFEDFMWNGYDCREVTTAGAQKAGIEKTKDKMVGRGVFLDMPRIKGVDCLEDGYPITCADLDEACEKQNVDVRGRLCGAAHRHDGALLGRRQLGRLCGRRCARPGLRDARLDLRKEDRRLRVRHLGQ